ncbi:MAG: family 10 glycosylhydrolase [Thermoguttaceae bacterium]
MQVRVAWGGGSERLWEGTIAVSQGTLSEPHPLGIEADEPGSMWLDEGRLMVRQRTARAYDGVDLLVAAPPEAKLLVQLTAADDAQRGGQIEVPLADLANDFHNLQLDGRGNRLLVRRTPGDLLRVRPLGESMVFAPGATLRLEVSPHLLPVPADAKLRLTVQLLEARDQRELWSKHYDLGSAAETLPLEITLPQQEGVYDVALSVAQNLSWTHPVRSPLYWKRPIAERKVQLLVLADSRPAVPGKTGRDLAVVLEIDPANPHWWEKVKLPPIPRLPRLPKGPLGNGCVQTIHHPLGDLVQLKPNAESPDVSWEAYWLSVALPGRPYLLEVNYPSDVPQTLGISVLEPNSAGALLPIGLDSGVDVPEELPGRAPHWARHRLVFWPRSATPLLLVTNRRERQPAVYGKIRVLGGWEHLPATVWLPNRGPERLLAAYMDRPLLPENFSASQAPDPWSGRSLDDWKTFYEAGTRLVEYLRYAGYNGLMLTVAADGSAIYPSPLLEPTPRYDTGVFFATAQDPLRKDVLEMLLRLLDREQLRLIPSIEFAAPLPALEALRRRGPAEAQGLDWIGPEGVTWGKTYAARRGLAPYYNTLDPRVQEAMLNVVRELVERYARHPSFAGLALRLSGDGYAQLPGPDWGLDDDTMARFARETGLSVPGEGPGRFAARAAFLAAEAHRGPWLQWRAAACHRFYLQLRAVLAAARPEAPLYLAGAEMFAGPELGVQLRPTLPRRATLTEALLWCGIDPRLYQEDRGICLLRPERIVPETRLAAQAVDLEIGQTPEADAYFRGLPRPGNLLFHLPQEVHVPSFDAKSPFHPSFAWLVAQPVPSEAENRRRLVHSLAAIDSQVLVDGGWLLPLGQEESLREVAAAFRRLPPVPLAAVGDGRAGPAQPVTFRYASFQDRTYAYAANDAPFPVTAQVRVEASANCVLRELTGNRQVAPLRPGPDGSAWSVDLAPYDLVAIEFSEPGVKLSRPEVPLPAGVEPALEQRIKQLGARAAALRFPPPLGVLENPGFERPATAAEPVPGWSISKRLSVKIQTDPAEHHDGRQSARISSDGPIACLVSRPFDPPTTGRISMSAWVRLADPQRQPVLRLAIEGKMSGRDYYRFAAIGRPTAAGQPAFPIGARWGQFIFQVDDLPLEGLSPLRVRFDLMGPGEVWIDDVQLFDLAFSETEVRALCKLITLAGVDLQNGQVGDCLRLLEGYWPRLLTESVPAPAVPPALAARPEDNRPPPAPPQPVGWLDRIKGLLPDRLR